VKKTAKRVPIEAAEHRRRHLRGVPHKVLRDPEVAAFVEGALASMTFQAIADACIERFGPGRAPGKSAVHRYWSAFHKGE